MKSHLCLFAAAFLILIFSKNTYAQSRTTSSSPIQITPDGKLTYKVDAKGDRVSDYSYCGYMLSEVSIPDVAVKVIVPAMKGDATKTIQTTIDYVSSLPVDKQCFHGSVLLEKETFEVAGGLIIHTSGVVMRGNGSNNDGTILIGQVQLERRL